MERIERMRIPDEDVPGWMQALREGGFTDEEIDTILSHNNREYARAKDPRAAEIEQELERIEQDLLQKYGRKLTDQQREYLRRSIASRPEFQK